MAGRVLYRYLRVGGNGKRQFLPAAAILAEKQGKSAAKPEFNRKTMTFLTEIYRV